MWKKLGAGLPNSASSRVPVTRRADERQVACISALENINQRGRCAVTVALRIDASRCATLRQRQGAAAAGQQRVPTPRGTTAASRHLSVLGKTRARPGNIVRRQDSARSSTEFSLQIHQRFMTGNQRGDPGFNLGIATLDLVRPGRFDSRAMSRLAINRSATRARSVADNCSAAASRESTVDDIASPDGHYGRAQVAITPRKSRTAAVAKRNYSSRNDLPRP